MQRLPIYNNKDKLLRPGKRKNVSLALIYEPLERPQRVELRGKLVVDIGQAKRYHRYKEKQALRFIQCNQIHIYQRLTDTGL